MLKIEDLKVGDVVIMTDTPSYHGKEFLNLPLTITRIDSGIAYTDMPWKFSYFYLISEDTFEYAIPHINESKFRKLLE